MRARLDSTPIANHLNMLVCCASGQCGNQAQADKLGVVASMFSSFKLFYSR